MSTQYKKRIEIIASLHAELSQKPSRSRWCLEKDDLPCLNAWTRE
uniref:Uncharacterized protein n=1 Tax=Lepeophtheirus salmonis TaxID=72036 RepID=A0A0K2T851_LEPSM